MIDFQIFFFLMLNLDIERVFRKTSNYVHNARKKNEDFTLNLRVYSQLNPFLNRLAFLMLN